MTTQNPMCWRFALCFAKFQELLNALSYQLREKLWKWWSLRGWCSSWYAWSELANARWWASLTDHDTMTQICSQVAFTASSYRQHESSIGSASREQAHSPESLQEHPEAGDQGVSESLRVCQ